MTTNTGFKVTLLWAIFLLLWLPDLYQTTVASSLHLKTVEPPPVDININININ
jgi:hypothetical protein